MQKTSSQFVRLLGRFLLDCFSCGDVVLGKGTDEKGVDHSMGLNGTPMVRPVNLHRLATAGSSLQ
eukprot:6482204-Amphidinium_carterae.1